MKLLPVLALLLLLLMPAAVLADGRMIPPAAFPAHVEIPDQEALIHFSNGTERLVIETRFSGAGTNFAWVVPLPSRPVVEAATTGVFPTLQYLFRPSIQHDIARYYIGILILIGLGAIFLWAARRGELAFVLMLFGIFVLAVHVFVPAFATAGSRSLASADAGGGVSILDRQLVGVFETTTIASQDPHALRTWLTGNGYALSTNTEPAIAAYVKEGWVFVAAKIGRHSAERQTNSPHPLSFTFKTEKPVYPMRLTGIDNGPVRVELYVFGPDRADAAHFAAERCTRPLYPQAIGRWVFGRSESLDIVHPLLRRWCFGAPVATKLVATLTPDDMRNDIWIDWAPFAEKSLDLFSPAGARNYALNWGAALLAGGLLVGSVARREAENGQHWLWRPRGWLVASLGLAGVIYCSLPKTDVRLVKRPGMSSYSNLRQRSNALIDAPIATLSQVRELLANSPVAKEHSENLLLGGQIHEEDSPGNYLVRQTNGHLQYLTYDVQGAEEITVDMEWP